MQTQSYTKVVEAKTTAADAFDKICHVSKWWATNFEGNSQKRNDIFTVRFKNGDMYTAKVSEMVPNEKIVWDFVDSYQGWHDDHTEWIGTQVIWKIVPTNDGVTVTMTHEGLTPKMECFEKCNQGWNYLLEQSLQKLLDTNEGMPV